MPMPLSGRSKRKKPDSTAGGKVQRGIKDHFSPTPALPSRNDAIVLVDDHDDDDGNHVEDMTQDDHSPAKRNEVVALDAEDDADDSTSNSTVTSTSSSSAESSLATSAAIKF